MLDANKISVVIPYYNDSSVFERCLASVVNQTLAAYEIIIVDDCSDDYDVLKLIVEKYEKFNVRLYRNSSNKNGAFSRNFGMSKAKGEYIALLDADDYWLPEHLSSSLLGAISTNADFVYSNVVNCNSNGEITIRKVSDLELNKMHPANVLLLSPPQTNSFFFKHSVLKNAKFDETLRRHQDFQFFLSVVMSGLKCQYLNLDTAVYCESHRCINKRVHFESIFKFWSENKNLVDEYLLSRFLVLNLILASNLFPSKIVNYIEEYRCFDAIRCSCLFRVIKITKSNVFILKSVVFLYFNIVYDYKLLFKKIIRKIKTRVSF